MFVELHPEQVTEADYPDFLGKTEAYYSRHTFDEHHACFVLCAGDMVAGCGTLIVRENPPRPTRVPNRSGYVRDVYILPEHRGNGGAHLIMAMIREEAARRRIWELGLHASDMGLPIYTSKGYKPNSSYLELGDV
jgi:GNAT superfamily N-acetyltransferase